MMTVAACVRNGMTCHLGTKWYDIGYEIVWDESVGVPNDLIRVGGGGGRQFYGSNV